MGDRVLDRVKRAAQVDGERLLPVLGAELFDRRPDAVDARVGEHDVEALELAHELLDRTLYGSCVCDIGQQHVRAALLLLDLLGDLLQLGFGPAQQPHRRALAREQQRRGTADA